MNVTKTWEDLPFNFSGDYLIASHFGKDAVIDTYKRAYAEYKDSYKIFVRLIYDTNLMCWYFAENGNDYMGKLFSDLYYKAVADFDNRYKKDPLSKEAYHYFFEKLD